VLARPLCGVLGHPVAHSRSPAIQNAAFEAVGLDWRYVKLPVEPRLFEETVRALPGSGYRGANVTIPHKLAALRVATSASPAARAVGAANTLTFEPDGTIHADNTDVPGLLEVIPLTRGRTALVLGAGGAGRAAAYALRSAGADVAVWNRTPERAERLARELGVRAVTNGQRADIYVNCTSIGLDGRPDGVKDLPLSADYVGAGSCVVDMVYRAGGTPLLHAAQAWGARTIDGLEVLIAQGAASFTRWTGRPTERKAMREAVDLKT
jgi:shikimate dehydrogenase